MNRQSLTLSLSIQVESFILDQEDLDNPVLKTASELLLSSAADGADLRTVDPETQARLEALLEAAGMFSSPRCCACVKLDDLPCHRMLLLTTLVCVCLILRNKNVSAGHEVILVDAFYVLERTVTAILVIHLFSRIRRKS